MAKGERDWAQLDSFEAEYAERLAAEKKRPAGESQFLYVLGELARGRGGDDFYADELKARDEATRRLYALRAKIMGLRAKVGLTDERLLPSETPFLPADAAKADKPAKERKVRVFADPLAPGHLFPVTFGDVRGVLAELPHEHAQTVREVRLSNQKKTGADGDWLDGEIRLHCMVEAVKNETGEIASVRRLMGRSETGGDVERFGGAFEWDGPRLFALWPIESYKTFLLRRVLIHEVAHGVAELPGYAEKVRSVGSVEKFCEQYAENFYKPPGRSVRLGF